ncbi:MAG: hypothetical protein IJ358_02630 [Clostridia bacterium]|nr:hypothetical protein [Clostridia bacterium]
MINDIEMQCPVILGTESLFATKRAAVAAQGEFFKTHTFLFEVLTENQVQVLKLRYGIDTGEIITRDKIAQQLGITGERVRQIEESAYKKLKTPRCWQLLEEYNDETIDRSLLEDLRKVPNFKSLIRKVILRTIREDSIEVIKDVNVMDLAISKTSKVDERIKTTLTEAGILTCGDLIKFLRSYSNAQALGLRYDDYSDIICAIGDLVDNGWVNITSKEHKIMYNAHKKADIKNRQEELAYRQKEKEDRRAKIENLGQKLKDSSVSPETILISDFDFSAKTHNALKRAGIFTLADLMSAGNIYLKIGHIGVEEITSKMNSLGVDILQIISINHKQRLDRIVANREQLMIEELGFGLRTYNCLKRTGINTLEDIINYYHEYNHSFYSIKNLGDVCNNEILAKMDELGIDVDHYCY